MTGLMCPLMAKQCMFAVAKVVCKFVVALHDVVDDMVSLLHFSTYQLYIKHSLTKSTKRYSSTRGIKPNDNKSHAPYVCLSSLSPCLPCLKVFPRSQEMKNLSFRAT